MYAARHACRRAAGALRRAEGASFVDNALVSLGQPIGTRVAGTRAFAASADAPLLVTMIGAAKARQRGAPHDRSVGGRD